MGSSRFVWDVHKAQSNRLKHGVTFDEATTAFDDPRSITVPDRAHSVDEERCLLVGRSADGRVIVVAHTDRGETIRIISARRASWRERLNYEQT